MSFDLKQNPITRLYINLSKESGIIKPDYEMGYISTVDEARKKLEKVFKLNQET